MTSSLTNRWYKPSEKKPMQGKKVLCMDKGDFFVLQRFGDYWFSIPFYDSRFSRYHEPELWQEIDFPNGLTGKMLVINPQTGELIDMEEVEKLFPKYFEELVKSLLDTFK